MKKSQQLIALENELKVLKEKHEIFCSLATKDGFYQTWFESLSNPQFKSGAAAFEHLNQLYYNCVMPPKLKYSCYTVFLTVNGRRKKKK